jgi:hypothetical protein
MPNRWKKQGLGCGFLGRFCTGLSERVAALAFFPDVGKDESFDTKVSGLVTHLVVGQVGGLHELVAALVGLVLERGEDAIAALFSSPLSAALLFRI